MPRQGNEQPVKHEITPGVYRWKWSDGSELTKDETREFGLRNESDPEYWGDTIGAAIGWTPKLVNPDAPGASLQTQGADAQRTRMQGFLDQLSQQAATGDGAWQQAFAQAVRQSQAGTEALGQSDARVDYGSALSNIGNAQAAIRQRAVGDEERLRAQAQLDARGQMADLLGQQAQMDLGQEAERARIQREVMAANQAAIDQSGKNRESTEKGISGGLMSMAGMSEGGKVPGRAQVFGNDERNDTQPAMLSPGEIVIPRDIAVGPDAPERAAAFVRAVQAGYNPRSKSSGSMNFAEGGVQQASMGDIAGSGAMLGYLIEPHIGRSMQYDAIRKKYGQGGAGGTIDTAPMQQTTEQQGALASLFAGQAAGAGPSVVPSMVQRGMDSNLGAALAAQGRGGVSSADLMKTAASAGSDVAADAGRQAAIEASQGQGAYGRLRNQMRGQQMQAASAQQQAGFGKILADMGLSLEQQAALRGSISGAGQAAAAFAGAGRGNNQSQNLTSLSDNPFPEDYGGSSPDEWENPYDDGPGGGVKSGMAYGGVVGMADGGLVARGPSGERLETDKARMEREADAYRKYLQDKADRELEDDDYDEVPRKKQKPTEKESAFARAVRGAGQFFRKAGASVVGMAEGGGVPSDAGMDPYVAFPFVDPPRPAPVGVAQPVEPSWWSQYNPRALLRSARDASIEAESKANAEASRMTPTAPRNIAAGPMSPAAGAPGMPAGPPPAGNIAAQEALAKTPGLRLKSDAPKPEADAATPTPAAPKGAGLGRRPSDDKAQQMERDAAQAGYEAAQARSAAEAQGAAAEASAIESQINERKALEARVQQRVNEARTRFEKAQEDMARIDATIDPGRFWATRSTGDKVMGILGMVLGALGAGPDGINKAAVMLNQAIDRDIDAQKSEYDAKLRKAGARVNAAQSFYAMARESAGDELGAMDLAHSLALKAVGANIRKMMAQTNDPAAKAQLQMLLAGIEMGGVERDQKAWDMAATRALEREKMEASKVKGGLPAAEQSKAIEVQERTGNIRRNIAQAKALIEQYGTMENFGTAETELRRLLGDIAQDSARLKDPNSTVKDQELINAKRAIGVEGGEFFTRNSTAQKLLDSYLATMEDREAEALRVRGLPVPKRAAK